ncbi:hypothetical protein SGRA_2164 [Saprospira grandis str. Lewin]|uniref:Uncharacterized protein n=1 Tax=Saprospira grandis (strain Lewin) TaxID=984262 RepID=H6L366_SAPGL|nr:hypothetical protein SGRA_2164 [Saprospira grandis str. Lewin]
MAKAVQLNLAEGWAAGPPKAADQSGFAAAGPSEQRAARQPDPPAGRGSPKLITS